LFAGNQGTPFIAYGFRKADNFYGMFTARFAKGAEDTKKNNFIIIFFRVFVLS